MQKVSFLVIVVTEEVDKQQLWSSLNCPICCFKQANISEGPVVVY